MIDIKGVAHFSIPVTEMDRSVRFYTDVVGCRELFTTPSGTMSFLDAGGICVILCQQDHPVDADVQGPNGVHHSFMVDRKTYARLRTHLAAKGVAVEFEEDRQGGVVNGPRLYFRDPDGTALEFIDLTSYSGARARRPARTKTAARAKAAAGRKAPSGKTTRPHAAGRKTPARTAPAGRRGGSR